MLSPHPLRNLLAVLPLKHLLLLAVFATHLLGAGSTSIEFNLPAGDARTMLRQFASQAKREILFTVETVQGQNTSAVAGRMTPEAAVQRMLEKTNLTASIDPRTAIITIQKKSSQDPVSVGPAAPTPQATPSAQGAAELHDGEIILSPFEVNESSDGGYGALNSNSITRFNVELDKVAASADILNEAFMKDVGASDVENMLRDHSAGVGTTGADPGSVAGANNPMDRFDTTLSLRGLASNVMQRDGFMPARAATTGVGFTTNFDIERVEVINGPQSLLYGFSGAGGAVNLVSKMARFNAPMKGALRLRVDEFGNGQGEVDFGVSRDNAALRVVATRQRLGNRRSFIYGDLDGFYGQVAVRLFGSTTLRLSNTYTNYERLYQNFATLTARSTVDDVRNGLNLRYLLATNQLVAPASGGAAGAGYIGNGTLDWDNIDSTAGRAHSNYTRSRLHTLTADTVWNRSFSTQIALGYAKSHDVRFSNGAAQYLAPNVAANPTGTWAVAPNPVDPTARSTSKAVRVSAVLSNTLFNGRAQSQTVFGADLSEAVRNRQTYGYGLADASGRAIVNASPTAANNGYTILGRVYTPLPNGPIFEVNPFAPGDVSVNVAGNKYVRINTNASFPELVSETNPLGLTGRGVNAHNHNQTKTTGVYLANFTSWFSGRLTSLAGLRAGRLESERLDIGTATIPSIRSRDETDAVNFNLGFNYELKSNARLYVSYSDSLSPPPAVVTDPYGAAVENSRGTGYEVGFKFSNTEKTLSGTLAYFHAESPKEIHRIVGSLVPLINPEGLNGEHLSPDRAISVDRVASGVQLAATALVRRNWRLRLSASHFRSIINTDKSFVQLYNDQFYANPQGAITYRDGTAVFVSTTETRVVPAGTANAVPLTIQLLNTPGNRYYANPEAETARINPASGAATALRTISAEHGPILTGITGLPISALQIAPLAGSPPIGTVTVSRNGDLAPGNPEYSLTLTQLYLFSEGRMKGLRLGGTVSKSWGLTSYQYYESGMGRGATPHTFNMPRPLRIDAIIGYQRKYGRYLLSTQLNVSNVFNRYDVVLLPSVTTGYTGARGSGIGATFNAEPRMYTWSAGVEF